MASEYSLWNRDGVYYVRFHDLQTGKIHSAKSTGFKDRREADYAVMSYLRGQRKSYRKEPEGDVGVLSNTSQPSIQAVLEELKHVSLTEDCAEKILNVLQSKGFLGGPKTRPPVFLSFLSDFWNFERSEYVQGRQEKGKRISRLHCRDMLLHIDRYWSKSFASKRIDEISLLDLERFSLELKNKRLSGKTINNILNAGVVSLSWAFERGIISHDPTKGYEKYAVHTEPRGVLCPDEVARLFSMPWPSEMARLANLLACTTGMRAGEVLALRLQDVLQSKGILQIQHAWNPLDGLKEPKWGSYREVVLLPAVEKALNDFIKDSHSDLEPNKYVFFGKSPYHPKFREFFNQSLIDMLLKMHPDAEYWKRRRVSYHSWRHYFTSRLTEHLGTHIVMKATGHKTIEAFKGYDAHLSPEIISVLGETIRKVFQGISK